MYEWGWIISGVIALLVVCVAWKAVRWVSSLPFQLIELIIETLSNKSKRFGIYHIFEFAISGAILAVGWAVAQQWLTNNPQFLKEHWPEWEAQLRPALVTLFQHVTALKTYLFSGP